MSALPPEDDKTVMPPLAGTSESSAGLPENESDALLPGTRIGEFEILRVIGVGGFGIVYLAHDHMLDCDIALKEYMPSSLAARNALNQVTVRSRRDAETFEAGMRSFINEARLLARFDHPSLVKVQWFREANNTAYMGMKYYQGQTLKQVLQQMKAPPSEAWLKRLLAPLLDALELLHAEQCFHRDIAPDNILVLPNGQPVLLDFGAARRAIGGVAQRFTVILKPGYAPIEQYADSSSMQQGPWTDIYALASVLHFAITGSAPAPSVGRMVSDQQQPLAKRAAGRYSSAFLEVIDRGLAVAPEQRPQSIAQLRSLLNLPAADVAPVRTKPRRSIALAAGVALLALAIGTTVFLGPDGPAVPKPAPEERPRTAGPAPGEEPKAAAVPQPTPPSLPSAPPERKVLEPADMLGQVFDARNPDHQVAVRVNKSKVQIGRDQLRFSITSSKSGYVYLFMVGTDMSQFWLLFPNALDRNNRISSAKPMDLPRPDWRMDASGPPGTNRFVAMVSESPRDFSAAGLARDGPFVSFTNRPDATAATDPAAAPLFAGTPLCETAPANACSQRYGAAAFLIEELPVR